MTTLLYRICSGINNKVVDARLPYDPEAGVTALETGMDMVIDRSGGLSTRRGSALVASGEYISAFPTADGGGFYAVRNRTNDSAIERVIPKADGSVDVVGLRSGLKRGAKTSFCLVDGRVYHMNGHELGVLDGDSATSWPVSEWPRENSTYGFQPVTAGSHFDILSGSFVISYGNELRYTETGLWGVIDMARNWERMESRVLMVFSVGSGVFVSDEKAVWFLEGKDPTKWDARKVLTYPADEYCRAPYLVDSSALGFETSLPSALFGTVRGPVVGLPDGSVFNLIDKKVSIPPCMSGAIMVVDETMVIQTGA